MAQDGKPYVIALEEHYWDKEVAEHWDDGQLNGRARGLVDRLLDLGELRLKEMDEAGIDVQVLSLGAPSTQRFEPGQAVTLARAANDRLYEVVQASPRRFQGFAALPTPDPIAAADELERAVTELGFKGAMVHGLTRGGLFIDDKRFWPIFECAQRLDVPIYLHPASPSPAVIDAYYKDYAKDFPAILNAGWGFTLETATQGLRMVLSGVCDEYPNLKLILGHMGEGLPFLLWRINHSFSRPGNKPVNFMETFRRNFWITTSGNFSNPALLCSVMEMGVDHILFSVDYPYVENLPGTEWMATVPLSTADKEKIYNGNAKRLLRIAGD